MLDWPERDYTSFIVWHGVVIERIANYANSVTRAVPQWLVGVQLDAIVLALQSAG